MDTNQKLNTFFAGKVVKKELTRMIKEGANVPVYVLEYLLGMYCASDDEATIKDGVAKVKDILSQNYVRPDEAEIIKSKIKQKGEYKIIDKISAKLNEKQDRYEAEFSNLGIKGVIVGDGYIKDFQKLLAGGIWCIIQMGYMYDENNKHESPYYIANMKPIQMPGLDMDEFLSKRKEFSLSEWMDILIRSTGMEPTHFDEKAKWHLIARLIPFVENNFNMCELGPRGTGKSFVYKEISPYSILVSGGQTTVANLFFNMANKTMGLVGLWDIVAFDEVAGIKFKEKDGVQIMKDYMESGSFARGKEQKMARASMIFVGNIDGSIENIVKTSHLLSPFPSTMIDTAFFDRFHHYLPGWEVPKMRPEFFTKEFGFITDFMAEWMRELQKHNFADAIDIYFKLGKDINQRDSKAIRKTTGGLLKLLFPDGSYTKEDVEAALKYALVGRRRIKEQLKKIGGMEFYDVHFSYIDKESGAEHYVTTPEQSGRAIIPEDVLAPGSLYAVTQGENGLKGLVRIDVQKLSGSGKFSDTGFGSGSVKEDIKEAISYAQGNLSKISLSAKYKDFDYHMKATNISGLNGLKNLELAIFLSIVSSVLDRPLQPQLAIIGSMNVAGAIIGVEDLASNMQVAADAGAKRVLIPIADMAKYGTVPSELMAKLQPIAYTDPIDAALKAMGV